ncbi:Ig-like domain-containing protein [Acetanaerobacterium elongatum]|uniref:S-layer homology domain-containing protein n=1 Tax=Acetanaerobacterium elongatum TaxID=258515 RepID=A0A1G9W9V9_9FIRM|nr:Ig-like domain-containing protein [Acetanaerobacterium elongatum]SDM81077.1 S-layer homology domain-containing protein [Acetanaerobacterium elongatum]
MRICRAAAALVIVLLLLTAPTAALTAQGEKENFAPKVNSKQCITLKNVPIWGYIEQYDPNGDKTELLLVKSPEYGNVTLYGSTFIYKPYPDITGADSFIVAAKDSVGNLSGNAGISVTIQDNNWDAGYCDMKSSPAQYSAIMLTKSSILSGERIGTADFFKPKSVVGSGEYLVMLLAAMGTKEDLAPCVSTGLENDHEIQLWLKPYVQYASKLGIISGNAFEPDKLLTKCEAVTLTAKAAGMKDVYTKPMYIKDVGRIPAKDLQSYINLAAYGMLNLYDGYARPDEPFTRADAADLLWQLYCYKQRIK